MRLGEMYERPVFLAARDGARQIPLESAAVVGLENFGIGPGEISLGKQGVGDLEIAAQPFKHEDCIGIFLSNARDDIFPRLRGDHVAGVAPEAVDTVAAPEQEHVGHVRAKLCLGVVELHKIGPLHPPCARRSEATVRLAAKPIRMMCLQSRGPPGVVGGKIDEKKTAPGMHRVYKLAELVERSCELVELRHRRIDAVKVERRERTAVFAHHSVCRRDREMRQRLDNAETHLSHYQVEPPRNLTERPELPWENRVDGIAASYLGAFNLYMGVNTVRPLGNR